MNERICNNCNVELIELVKKYRNEIEELKNIADTLQSEVIIQAEQIKKMKNCQNCKYYDCCGLDNVQCSECFNGNDKWELAE